jgi:uncharacterized protein (DUF58 family)
MTFPGWSPEFQAVLGRLAIAARRRASSPFPGEVRSSITGRAIEFADYRTYVSGDEPRLLDWRVYARTGKAYVRRQLEDRERMLTVMLDVSGSHDFGAGDTHKGLYARRLAAALTWISASRHEPVRVWLLRNGEARALAPVFTLNDLPRIVAELAAVREEGDTRLGQSVPAALRTRPRGPVVLISDLLHDSWREACLALARHECTLLQPLAPDEFEPVLAEEVELEDVESGERMPGRLGPVEVEAYQTRLTSFLAEVSAEARRLSLLHLLIRTDAPLVDVVINQMTRVGLLTA